MKIVSQTLSETRLRASDPAVCAWVRANAGAGKTSLLVARVLRMLLTGTPPSRILCITYTKAAAAEMAARIMEDAGRWAVQPEAELAAELKKLNGTAPAQKTIAQARMLFTSLVDAPEGLRIQTIHGFCQSLLARFPLEAGIAPHAQVLDERSSAELLREAMQRVYALSAAGEDKPLVSAINMLAARLSDYSFQEVLGELTRERRRLRALLEEGSDEAAARRALCDLLKLDPQLTQETLLAETFHYAPEERSTLHSIMETLFQAGGKTNTRTAEALKDWLAGECTADAYAARFLTQKNTPAQLFTKHALNEEGAGALLAEQKRVTGYVEQKRCLTIAELSCRLLTVGRALFAEYDRLKRRRAVLDYDDLIVQALKLLSGPGASQWVMFKLDGGIDHILVDEAQDTSAEQWAIVRALTEEFFAGVGARPPGGRSLFVVGDLKQSIFRFQGAEPALFEEMCAYFRERAQAAHVPWEEVELPESFRSTAPVLEAVDAVFAETGLGAAGEMRAVSHVLQRHGASGRVEVWPLMKAEPREETSTAPASSTLMLAEAVSGMIAQMLGEGMELPALGRAIQPGDIMVLVRRRGALAEALLRGLKRHGVKVAGADRMQLLSNLAVQDMLALASFLLMPEDDLTLAALLKTPLFNIDEDKLFALCHERGEASLWQRLWQKREEGAEFAQACEWLSALLERADRIAPYELFAHALGAMNGRERMLARLGGHYAEALDELLNQALAFEATHLPSLQGFLRWINAGASEIRRDMDARGGQVRVMTVHGAKGLEAPLVILPDTASLPPVPDRLLWHEDGARTSVFWPSSASEDSALTSALRQQRRTAELAEHNRLLYVAMTRATERLILCGAAGGKAISENAWHGVVWRALEKRAEKMLTPAGEGLLLHAPQTAAPSGRAEEIISRETPPPPPWISQAPPEEKRDARPLAASHVEEERSWVPSPAAETQLYRRGAALHRMLQYLPDIPAARRREAALAWVEHFAQSMPEAARAELAEAALNVVEAPVFAHLFGDNALAEVPVSGMIDGISISGQIDRLVVMEREVWVVDYKTHARPPQSAARVPRAIVSQLAAYRRLLQGIYPGRDIRAAVLWTGVPQLMELPPGLLDETHFTFT